MDTSETKCKMEDEAQQFKAEPEESKSALSETARLVKAEPQENKSGVDDQKPLKSTENVEAQQDNMASWVKREVSQGLHADQESKNQMKEEQKGGEGEDEEDESKDDEEEDEGSVDNPSIDIRSDFQDALSGSLGFTGSFYVSKPAPNAPNPALQLADLGPIGLPLSQREAKVIASRCIQAPFGKAERTVVDTKVRDTWEMDASLVRFGNPAWQTYIQTVIRDVCQTLGVNFAASNPKCELYKLLLYETGSHFLPHKDTEKAPGMFATVVIVLPSQFTGGEVHVSHGSLSKVLDCSATSGYETTILSWYTDVTHEVKPITSGYRLALAYNLMHTTTAVGPALPSTDATADSLRHILRSWKHNQKNEDKASAPSKLVYLLEHRYGQEGLKGSSLKGKDAHILSLLNRLAEEQGFHIGLASVECHVTGCGDDYGGGRYGCWYDEEDDDDDDVSMAEVIDREMSITDLVDLYGTRIRETLDYEEEETIPSDLRDTVESGPHDEQEYEGYMGNGAGSLERWYRRTVLVIWPDSSHFDIIYGGEDYDYAFTELGKIKSARPTTKEKEFVQYVLRYITPRAFGPAARAVSRLACQWEDFGLWQQVITSCVATRSVSVLTTPGILKAIETFGFESVRPTLERILANDPGNQSRYDLIREISQRLGNTQPRDETFTAWISEEHEKFVRSLKAPTKEEGNMLIQLSLENGGLTFLHDVIIPQVKAVGSAEFLKEFALSLQLHEAELSLTASAWTLRHCTGDILIYAIQKADLYAAPTNNLLQNSGYQYSNYYAPRMPDPQITKGYVGACVKTGNDFLLGELFQKLFGALPSSSTITMQQRLAHVVLPLVSDLRIILGTSGNIVQAAFHVASLARTTIEQWDKFPVPDSGVTSLLEAVLLSGDSTVLSSKIILNVKKFPADTQQRKFVEEMHARREEFYWPATAKDSLSSVTADLVNFIVSKARITTTAVAIEYLEFCQKASPASRARVILRLLNPGGDVSEDYIKRILVPFIPELRRFLVKHHLSAAAEPFSSAFKAIMVAWLNKVLGAKSTEAGTAQAVAAVKQVNCLCNECRRVVQFLTNTASPERQLTLYRIGAPKRRHVEQYLDRYCRSAATYEMIRSSPQGLIITKADCIWKPATYRAHQTEGRNILNSISTSKQELQKIFGADYGAVVERLDANPSVHKNSTVASGQPASAAPRQNLSSTARIVASMPAAPRPPVASSSTSAGVLAASIPSSSALPSRPATQVAPTKKRKAPIDHNDFIDLT